MLTIDFALKTSPNWDYLDYSIFFIGNPPRLHLRNFCLLYKLIKDKDKDKDKDFFGVVGSKKTLSGHQYYEAPTLAYSYRFFTFIKNLIVKKEN